MIWRRFLLVTTVDDLALKADELSLTNVFATRVCYHSLPLAFSSDIHLFGSIIWIKKIYYGSFAFQFKRPGGKRLTHNV